MFLKMAKKAQDTSQNKIFQPLVAHIDITNSCNLHCIHCRCGNERNKKSMSLKNFKKIIKNLKKFDKLTWISLGGGEPLLNKNIFEMIVFCKDNDFKVLVTTNGTLLDKKWIKQFETIGLDRIQISLDGASKKIHDKIRGNGSFKKTMEAIKNLKKSKIDITCRMTLNKINFKEGGNFVKKMNSLGIKLISIRKCVPHGYAKSNISNLDFSKEEYAKILQFCFDLADKLGVHLSSGDPIAIFQNKKIIKNIDKLSKKIIGGCSPGISYLYIDSSHKIKPCPMLDLVLGDALNEDIINIWENSEFYKRIRSKELKGKCEICNYKQICGGCRARALFYKQNLWEEDPECAIK